MSSNRKIWSVPIAVLALALMLVGGMVASSVVRAQTVDNETFYMVVGATGAMTVMVEGLDGSDSESLDAISTADDAVTLAGTGEDSFVAAASGSPTTDGDADETQDVTITPATGDDAPAAGVYSLTLSVEIDLDTSDDGSDDDGTLTNDDDRTITSSVTIYVVGAPSGDDRVPFHAASETAFEGERVSAFGKDLRSSPQYIQVTGLGPNSKIEVDSTATGADVTEGVLSSQGGLNFILDPNDGSKIIAQAAGDPVVSDTDTIDFNISVDPDTTDETDTALTVPVQASLTEVDDIDWLPTAEDGTTVGPPFSFTMLSNDPAGTVVGEVDVSGAANAADVGGGATTGEFLDGILLASDGSTQAMFSVRGGNGPATGAANATLQIVYSGNGSLTTGTMTFRLSVNGDSGIAHRTISNGGPDDELNNVTITVNPVNEGPMGPDTHAARVTETAEGTGILDSGDEVADMSGLATDTNVLVYSLVTGDDSSQFTINSSTGVVTVGSAGIADNAVTTAAVPDNPATTTINEAMPAVYGRNPDDGGELVDPSSMYSDIEYEFTVNVSDGNAASSHNIAVTLVVDVNEPVTEMGDIAADEPSYETTDVQNHEIVNLNDYLSGSDSPDDDVTYVWEIEPVNPPFGIYDGSIRVNYPGPSRPIADNPATTDVDESWDPEEDGWTIRVLVGDAFANGSGPLACTNDTTGVAEACSHADLPNGVDAVLDFTITQTPGPPLQSFDLVFEVDENAVAGTPVGTISVEGATTYAVISGTGGARDDFAVDTSTGEITVVNPRDYDAESAENNIVLLVDAFGENGIRLGAVIAGIAIQDIDEKPEITTVIGTAWVYESAQLDEAVLNKVDATADPSPNDPPIVIEADDPEGGALSYRIDSSDANLPFSLGPSSGALTVTGALDRETQDSYTFDVVATDAGGNNSDALSVTVHILDTNEAPVFTSPLGDDASTAISEARTYDSGPIPFGPQRDIMVFQATDEDGDDIEFGLIAGPISELFEIANKTKLAAGHWQAELRVKQGSNVLDYEDEDYDATNGYFVQVVMQDGRGKPGVEPLRLIVKLNNVNDNAPEFDSAPAMTLSVLENTARGTVLANYSATDADGQDVTYSLDGDDAKSFMISDTGDLMTLESLDADRQVPCGAAGCSVTVIATDVANDSVIEQDAQKSVSATVSITVLNQEDSVSTLDVSKANPVPGTEMGNPMSALSNAKTGGDEYLWNMLDCAGMLDLVHSSDEGTYCKMWDDLSDAAKKAVMESLYMSAPAESPYDLPATEGSSPMNFVETEWANWGTVLRIEVTAESPGTAEDSNPDDADNDIECGNGNECVIINVNSDSADDSLRLKAYRVDTPAGAASNENHYVAALMLVELSSDATPGDGAVYKHTDGGVPALKVDEEDEVEIEFGNLRDTIEVENEAPEVSNFAPEHERAFDDADVDYTFTITDSHSGLPEPEDLPDNDGDADYTPVVALISKSSGGVGQCSVSDTGSAPKDSDAVLSVAAHIHEDDVLYCPGGAQVGEYEAADGGFGFAPIRDDKDFDEIDNGYDVETTIVLTENDTYYVTFIVCDNAGNCAYHDPDGNDDDEELAEITVDTEDPVFVEARTGLNWDSTDNEYDDDRNYIQVIFDDLTTLNPATVEVDDFVVEGHTIVSVTVYENPDDEDVEWADSGRYAEGGNNNLRHKSEYRDLENAVFIELADELLADETPDVTIVPNGVEDGAGNEQDDGDHEADDWISPKFTIVSITSTLETAQDEVLAGDGDEVTVVVTSDERLDATRPTVTVTYVNAPAGTVDTKGQADCDNADGSDGTRDRGEIVLDASDDCQGSRAAGGMLNNSVEKVSNTEWIVTVTEPKDTGYYSFRISGVDRSPQENPGSEGIAPADIVTDFFDSDGDVNTDDAVFWEGDINLANPNVRVSGNVITDNEPDIEYRSPLFVEIDFTANHSGDCRDDDDSDYTLANCMNENSEYAEDNFDDIVITMFELDGVDMTDSVKTTDDQTFLVSLENVSLGDHTARIQAMDVAGNTLEDVLEIDFEVSDREPFENRLNPGWNLVSLPGEPADSAIGSVFGPGVEVRTVYTYDPVVPGGWMVAVRETLDSDWQGDLTEITGTRGYWVLSDAIQDWEVSIPRLAGGAAGTGTPIQPPVIPLYAGWNLIPVTDISGNAGDDKASVSATVYLQNLDDGLDLARVLGFDTIRNQWFTVLDPMGTMSGVSNDTLSIGSAYWIFVREAASLVPSGFVSGGGSD